MSGNGNGTTSLPWKTAGTDSMYCKIGGFGPLGSGKTTTMTWIARLIARLADKKTVYMIDSEGGSDFVANVLERDGRELKAIKTREFGMLVQVFEAMQSSGEIILVDSVTHFSDNVKESYLKARNRTKLELRDWGPVNDTWRLFTKLYVNSQIHALLCGRMGFEYDTFVNEDGKTEFFRSDEKMKAADQIGHEPALLFQMAQIDNAVVRDKLRTAATKEERAKIISDLKRQNQIDFVCTIEKDRTRLIQGKRFVFSPTGDDEQDAQAVEEVFLPVIQWHLKNTSHGGIAETGATTKLLAPSGTEFDWQEKKRRREIALEELEAQLVRWVPGVTGKDKALKGEIVERLFGTRSWTKISTDVALERVEGAVAVEPGKPHDGANPSEVDRICAAVVAERTAATEKAEATK